MKRSAAEECETELNVKKIRTDLNSSALARSGSLLVENSSQPKDGIIEEVCVTNFMSFNSHRFRLALNFDTVNTLHSFCKQLQLLIDFSTVFF